MSEEPDFAGIATKVAARVQNNPLVRKLVGALLITAFTAVAGYFVYDLLPRTHNLTISGGEITSNRHFLAKVLEEEARANGVDLKIVPTRGSIEVLEKLESGELDMAFSQGGLEPGFDNVVHVATIAPEMIHLLVKPSITSLQDLRGKVINLGSRTGGTRVVAQAILSSSGLEPGVDYAEANLSNDRLITLRPEQLPDAVVNVSFLPSFIADFLVKERGYTLLEIPFPGALALRMGWVAGATVPAYTYNANPPVPAQDIVTVGVNLHLLANDKVPPRAIAAVLETLYSPPVISRTRLPLDEANILLPSGFPLSPGTLAFTSRHEPVLSGETLEQVKGAAGLAFSLISGGLIMVRWFRGKPIEAVFHDEEIKQALAEVAAIRRQVADIRFGRAGQQDVAPLSQRLSEITVSVLERAEHLNLSDPSLLSTFVTAEASARADLMAL